MTRKASRSPRKTPPRRRLGRLLLWVGVFLLILLAADRLLLRGSPAHPLLQEVQSCYEDLRRRLLSGARSSDPVADLLDTREKPLRSYFYADDHGVLHFVDSLQQVPLPYRSEAQVLEE